MSSTAVSVVLVHGAWADGSSWMKVIGPLPLTGFRDDGAALDRTRMPWTTRRW
jgi:hypothetical protein